MSYIPDRSGLQGFLPLGFDLYAQSEILSSIQARGQVVTFCSDAVLASYHLKLVNSIMLNLVAVRRH